jgi:hypothetical protein
MDSRCSVKNAVCTTTPCARSGDVSKAVAYGGHTTRCTATHHFLRREAIRRHLQVLAVLRDAMLERQHVLRPSDTTTRPPRVTRTTRALACSSGAQQAMLARHVQPTSLTILRNASTGASTLPYFLTAMSLSAAMKSS